MEDKSIAKYRRERQKCEQKSDFKKAADLSNLIGECLSNIERYEEAIEEHQHELFLCETTNDIMGIAVANRKIGECYSKQGNFDQALEYEKKYLHISQKEGNDEEIQRALATLGWTHLCQAEMLEDHRAVRQALNKAKKAFIQSLETCERLRTEISEVELADMKARLCLNMGLIYDKQYNTKKAMECFKRGISLSLEHKVHETVFRCRKGQAGGYQKIGDHANAIKVYDAALKYAESIKDKFSQAEILTQKALIYLHLKDLFAAKRSIKKAYKLKAGGEVEKVFKGVILIKKLTEELKNLPETANEKRLDIFEKLGDTAAEVGNYKQAVEFYEHMLSSAVAEGKSGLELEKIYESLAATYSDAGEFSNAVVHFKKKLECVEEDVERTVKTYMSMADTMEMSSEAYEKVEETYRTALQHANLANDVKLQAKVLRELSAAQSFYKRVDDKDETDEKLRILEAEHDINSEEEMSEARDSQDVTDDFADIDIEEFLSDDDDTDDEEFDREKPISGTKRVARRKTKNQFKKNEKGEYPLHIACINGELEKARALISQGHPVNVRDNAGWMPLHEAANHNHAALVELLLDHGAWIDDRGGKDCDGITPLHDACGAGSIEVVELLVSRGANVHAENNSKATALDNLISYRIDANLSQEDVSKLHSVEKLLKDSMKGNIPQMSQDLTVRSSISQYDAMDSNDDLPTIQHKRRSKHDRIINREDESIMEAEDRRRASWSSLSGKRRRSEDDDEGSDYEDHSVYSRPSQPSSSVATDLYQETIASMRRSAVSTQSSNVRRLKLKSKRGPALVTDSEDVGDDWLIDDVGDQRRRAKRKRTDVEDILQTTGTRRSGEGTKRRSSGGLTAVADEEGEECFPHASSSKRNSSGSLSSRKIHIEEDSSSNDVDPVHRELEDNELMLLDETAFMIDNIPSQVEEPFTSQHIHNPPLRAHNVFPTQSGFGLSASFQASHSTSSKPRQTKLTTFGVTKTTVPSTPIERPASKFPATDTGRPRMRLKVRIKDKCILLAITDPEESISWLIDLASDRYYKLYGMRPLLSLTTRDGAVLSPEDPISFLLSNDEEVEGLVESWDLPPLPERYKDACSSMKTVMYSNIRSLLNNATGSQCLRLSNLALRPSQFAPICKALQCQNSLKEIHINGNHLGDDGFNSLCKVIHTLPSLRVLNLSSNQISGAGLRTLATVMEQPDKPLQVLEVLDLSFNPLGDSCTQTLAVIIRQFTALVTLRLRSCDLSLRFFQQHRIQLADALHERSLNELDIAYNNLGSTGVELLLKSVRPATLCTLNLSGTVSTYTSNNIHKHLHVYMLHPECNISSLFLDNCHIHQELWPEVVSIVGQCKSLVRLSLSANPKIDNNDVQELLEAASQSSSSKLSSVTLNGCNIKSPISTNFLDGINDKLNHSYPLHHLEWTSRSLNKCDCDALRDIWVSRWSDQAKIDLSQFRAILSTTVMNDELGII